MRGENAIDLLLRNKVSYESLHEYQRPLVDRLIEHGIIENTGGRIRLKDPDLFYVLRSLNDNEAVAVAVGTALPGGPPHRSQRAELPHWAPALGSGVEAHVGEWMLDAGGW